LPAHRGFAPPGLARPSRLRRDIDHITHRFALGITVEHDVAAVNLGLRVKSIVFHHNTRAAVLADLKGGRAVMTNGRRGLIRQPKEALLAAKRNTLIRRMYGKLK
jgi:hypothetical protein